MKTIDFDIAPYDGPKVTKEQPSEMTDMIEAQYQEEFSQIDWRKTATGFIVGETQEAEIWLCPKGGGVRAGGYDIVIKDLDNQYAKGFKRYAYTLDAAKAQAYLAFIYIKQFGVRA